MLGKAGVVGLPFLALLTNLGVGMGMGMGTGTGVVMGLGRLWGGGQSGACWVMNPLLVTPVSAALVTATNNAAGHERLQPWHPDCWFAHLCYNSRALQLLQLLIFPCCWQADALNTGQHRQEGC